MCANKGPPSGPAVDVWADPSRPVAVRAAGLGIKAAYAHGRGHEQEFIQQMNLFLTSFFREHIDVRPTHSPAPKEGDYGTEGGRSRPDIVGYAPAPYAAHRAAGTERGL